MRNPFAKFEEEIRKQVLITGANIYKMLKAGKSLEEISHTTGLNKEEIEEIKNYIDL
jgi:hypothetical protein